MKDIQLKIKALVEDYIRLFPEEYESVKRIVKDKRELQKKKTAELENFGFVERALFEYPARLFNLLQSQLTEDEKAYFQSKEGARWFGRTFKEFLITNAI